MTYYPPVSPYQTGLACKCPRCGQGPLFDGYLSLRKTCRICQLDLSKADSADGPAVFVMFITGFVGVSIAFVSRFLWGAPTWLALLLSIMSVSVLTIVMLRPMKATMVALQYIHKAKEGRLNQREDEAAEPPIKPPTEGSSQ